MFDLVVKDGTLIMATGLKKADVGILGSTITAIEPDLSGRETIDARDMLVIPGGVDPHVHFDMPAGQYTTSDTWESGSRAAALGGTTTVIDFVEPAFPGQPLQDALAARQRLANAGSVIDYSLHMTLCTVEKSILQEVPEMVSAGLPSFKLYTTYEGFGLDDEALLLAFEAIGEAGGIAMVHAESDAILRFSSRRLMKTGRVGLEAFADSRPPIAEIEAVQRVLALARYTRTPVYLAHLSTSEGV